MKNRFFTSKAGIIALLLLVLHPLSMSAQVGINSDRNVIFLHGLGGNSTDWRDFVNRYAIGGGEPRRMTSNNQFYPTTGSLNTIFAGAPTSNRGASSLAIGHSLGGVVARNLDRTNPGTFAGGLITVGSPLDGATIANSVLDGRAASGISNGTSTMLRGPYATLAFLWSPLFTIGADAITATFLPSVMNFIIIDQNVANLPTMNDLQVGGNGIELEKAAAPTATPKISIWGNEESPTHWNILGTMQNKNVANIADITADVYGIVSLTHLTIGAFNWWNGFGWWNFFAAFEWYAGYDWLAYRSEPVWNHIIRADLVGTQCYQEERNFCQYDMTTCDDMNPRQWANCQLICNPGIATFCVQVHSNGQSDGWIPATSQRGDGSNSWRVANGAVSSAVAKREALGVNHFEEIEATNPVMQGIFRDIFDRSGSDIAPVFQINRR